jgi:1,4-dihydroxy-2-naphthoyl-CoA hydrolase
MLTEQECELMNAFSKGTMMETLGMKFVPTDDEFVVVDMPISSANIQHKGVVHGGAYLTMAETAAGAGSLHIAGLDAQVCGIDVAGNHVHMSPLSGTVTARASIIHAGHTIHVWNVDIFDEQQNLLSTVRVVNRILIQQQS